MRNSTRRHSSTNRGWPDWEGHLQPRSSEQSLLSASTPMQVPRSVQSGAEYSSHGSRTRLSIAEVQTASSSSRSHISAGAQVTGDGAASTLTAPTMRRSIMPAMQLTTGTVVGGKVVVEGDPLPEGAVVTILAREANETFELPPELEAVLLESIAQADRGETISAEEMLERLRRIA